MENVLEIMNRGLVVELYELKKQLKLVEEINGRRSLETQFELNQTQAQLKNAEERIAVQERIISDLRHALNQLHAENVYLAGQNQQLLLQSEPKIENFLDFQTIRSGPTAAAAMMPVPRKENEPEVPLQIKFKPVILQPQFEPKKIERNEEAMKDKTNMIANIKLKLGLAQTQAKDDAPSAFKTSVSRTSELRLFVGRLCPVTDEKVLKEYFSTFGNVTDVFFPIDSAGGTRGFAFVTFSHLYGKNPLKVPKHVINGKEVYLDVTHNNRDEGEPSQTLLVSGIINDASDEAITNHFSKYGKIVTVIRTKESRKKYCRYAFVHFDNCKSVEKALDDPIHMIDEHSVDLRRARDFHYSPPQKEVEQEPTVKSAVPCNIPKKPLILTSNDNQSVDVKKLLIHNLGFSTTTDTIRTYFSKFGKVLDAYIPTTYGTNDSKGFGYIVMHSCEVNFNYNNHIIDNRVVHISKEASSHLNEKSSTLLVSAGPEVMAKVSEKDLEKFFAKFGKITSVRKPADSLTKKTSHFAFVEFSSCRAVDKALECKAYMINGQIICITKSRFDPHK